MLNFIAHINVAFFLIEHAIFLFFLDLLGLVMIIWWFLFNIRFPLRLINTIRLILLIQLLKYLQPSPPPFTLVFIISRLIYNWDRGQISQKEVLVAGYHRVWHPTRSPGLKELTLSLEGVSLSFWETAPVFLYRGVSVRETGWSLGIGLLLGWAYGAAGGVVLALAHSDLMIFFLLGFNKLQSIVYLSECFCLVMDLVLAVKSVLIAKCLQLFLFTHFFKTEEVFNLFYAIF